MDAPDQLPCLSVMTLASPQEIAAARVNPACLPQGKGFALQAPTGEKLDVVWLDAQGQYLTESLNSQCGNHHATPWVQPPRRAGYGVVRVSLNDGQMIKSVLRVA